MARKYVNFRVGGSPYKETDAYTVWTNDLLGKVIASKPIIHPGQSTPFFSTSLKDYLIILQV